MADGGATGPLVLVADDSATLRLLATSSLESAGYRVREAPDGWAALEEVAAGGVDVVLLDVEMPGLDGHEVLARLKADPATRDVPVVFLTGRSGSEDMVQALRDGAHDDLRKPPDPTELLARVGGAARVKALQDELRARLEDLDRIGRTDVLTGLHNRRHLQEHLESLCSAARRHGLPLTVLLVDVDHFKAVNDRLGHGAGDAALRAVAARLADTVRTEDLVGRWGGEEFLVLAPLTGVPAGRRLAERLRAAVCRSPLTWDGTPLTLSVSIGGAISTGGDGAVPERLLRLADENLYAAKSGGRDRCVVEALPDAVE